MLDRYPYELSGGQRQRIGFAQALAYRPKLIVADEPVSMLDVSIRIGLLNLMTELRDEQGVSLLYITHDIASARYVADRIMVMYAGHLVETGPVEDVLQAAASTRTRNCCSTPSPTRGHRCRDGPSTTGEPPRVVDPAPGCRFRWRCPLAVDMCSQITPELVELAPRHDRRLPRRGAGRGAGATSPSPCARDDRRTPEPAGPHERLARHRRYDAMPYRRCGRSGLLLPAISLGLWHNFGHDRPLEVQRAILRRAFDLGITHFDLANNYGPPYGVGGGELRPASSPRTSGPTATS